MVRNVARAACGLALALVVMADVRLAAQDAVLAEFYGRGVHQYFSGNLGQAVLDLTAAIDGGSKDPRAYYFRALAELKLGQPDLAAADLQIGAALESADINQFYPVGKSLERVQGSARMSIERYRSVARAQAHMRQERRNTVRYEQRRRAEGQVLRAPQQTLPAPPAAKPPAAEPVTPAAAEAASTDDPFAEKSEPAAPAGEPAESTEESADATEEMPVEEAPAEKNPPAAAAGDEDPFGEPPAKEPAAEAAGDDQEMPAEEPAADAKAAEPAQAGDENPFGDESDAKEPK